MGTIINLEAVITSASKYSIAEGGKTNEGITLNYLITDTLEPVQDGKGLRGYKFSKASIQMDREGKLIFIPGYYKMSCEMSVGSNGAPVLKPVDVDFLKHVKLTLTEPGRQNKDNSTDKQTDKK